MWRIFQNYSDREQTSPPQREPSGRVCSRIVRAVPSRPTFQFRHQSSSRLSGRKRRGAICFLWPAAASRRSTWLWNLKKWVRTAGCGRRMSGRSRGRFPRLRGRVHFEGGAVSNPGQIRLCETPPRRPHIPLCETRPHRPLREGTAPECNLGRLFRPVFTQVV